MHPSKAYFWSELATLLQSIEHALNTLVQALAAYVPALLTALIIMLVVGGLAYLSKVWVRPAGAGTGFTNGEIVVTEAGILTVLQRAEEDLEIIAATWKMDHLPPERASCN